MDLLRRTRNKVRGFLQLYGIRAVRRFMWNKEYFGGRWACLDSTADDCVYPFLEKYARKGSILDLGCGAGNTGCELAAEAYRDLTGVDISDVAIEKATQRTHQLGRAGRNRYVQGDIVTYEPRRRFDVILFRESIYYVPRSRIQGMLRRYSDHLEDGGVFLVRFYDLSGRQKHVLDIIEADFHVVERILFDNPSAAVLVFRPKTATR